MKLYNTQKKKKKLKNKSFLYLYGRLTSVKASFSAFVGL